MAMEGMPIEAVADVLGVRPAMVNNLLFRAAKNVKH
jgi:DNA-directed RNA polymerase specialized sigma24 family protein